MKMESMCKVHAECDPPGSHLGDTNSSAESSKEGVRKQHSQIHSIPQHNLQTKPLSRTLIREAMALVPFAMDRLASPASPLSTVLSASPRPNPHRAAGSEMPIDDQAAQLAALRTMMQQAPAAVQNGQSGPDNHLWYMGQEAADRIQNPSVNFLNQEGQPAHLIPQPEIGDFSRNQHLSRSRPAPQP